MESIDTCVVGAGVVGLAVARALAQQGAPGVLLLDQAAQVGQGISSRNSEVLHAGIYYPADSLKAQLCVDGQRQLYAYCQARQIPHARCGKLIVATCGAEEAALHLLGERGEANGVLDLVPWSAARIARFEPQVRATLALYSPSTGIISAHDLMASLLTDLEAAGGTFAGLTRVLAIEQAVTGFVVRCQTADGDFSFECRRLVNAAGLGAQALASCCDFLDDQRIPRLHLCKGHYFSLQGASPFQHLIYPVPEAGGAGLGVHATLDLGGQVKFGPDVEFVSHEDYAVPVARAEDFAAAIRRYYPALQSHQLIPGYAGIRPKLQGPGEDQQDFMIQGPEDHGIAGLVQLFGIESPGLTASLAIADRVTTLAGFDEP